MKLLHLCTYAGIECDKRYADTDITSVVSDSRRVCDGCVYVCVKGEKHDGHEFICSALERGAVAVVCDAEAKIPDIFGRAAVIRVKNTRTVLAYFCSALYGDPQNSMRMIGVTGTNGKTTVSRMIYEILRHSGRRAGVIGTLGAQCCGADMDIRSENELSNMTTPEPEELYRALSVMRERGVEFVVMEVSSHSLVQSRVAPIHFDVGVFTNLTPEHLDFHGDMESYFEAKRQLFLQCGSAVINCDDIYGRRLYEEFSAISTGCSVHGGNASVCAEQIRLTEKGISYKLCHPSMRARITCQIPGEFTVTNSLEAVVTCHGLGVSTSDIQSALALLSGVDGRLERVPLDRSVGFSVFIDYAHTPDALENLLRTARGFSDKRNRIVLVFGCGGDRDRSKRAKMGRIASAMADLVIVTSDNSRSEERADIIGEILQGIDKETYFTVIEDRAEAIEYAIKNARDGDIILLAGKGHERYEISKQGKTYFCERELVTRYADKYCKRDNRDI